MAETNQIGLEVKQTEKLANDLNDLLANYQVFYMNVLGFHWNIRGDKFFELHAKFEELYTELRNRIDEIAERLVTLGYTPLHSFSDYIARSEIVEMTSVSDGYKAVEDIIAGLRILLIKQRELLQFADENGDEGTYSLMSDYIRRQEKLVWMYSAYLGRKIKM